MNTLFMNKLCERIIPGSLGQIFLLLVLSYGSLDTVQNLPAYRLLISLGLLLNLFRFAAGLRHRIHKSWKPTAASAWLVYAASMGTALSWGGSALLLLRASGMSSQTWMAFMLMAGTGTSAAISLAPIPRLAQTFVCLLLAPSFLQLLTSSDPLQWSIAAVFALYFIFLQSHILYQEKLSLSILEKESLLQVMMDTAFNSIPGIVWTAKPDGNPDFFNKTWFDYTAIPSRQNLSGWKEALHPDDFEKFKKISEQAQKRGEPYETEFRIKRARDQSYRLHVAQVSPAKDLEGNTVKWFGTCIDVEDRRIAEEEKSKAIVREKAAIESARLKSEFLANMSHEVRTPLNGILGMTELLLDARSNEHQEDYLRIIRDSGEALLAIINDILDFSKIEAGKLHLEQMVFELPAVIEGQVDLMNSRAQAKGLALKVSVDPRIPTSLIGDSGRIGQILLNLIGNAVKFTQKGTINVHALYCGKENSRIKVTFFVQDEGVGIRPEIQRLLFQPFTQADSSTARHFGGTGLGLSICKRLIQMMDGQIGVESELGKGSKFWFTLDFARPIVADQPSTDPTPMIEESAVSKLDDQPARHQRILVAEDNSTNQVLIVATLKKLGFSAQVASNGKEALDAIRMLDYDLVLMDCQMPEMDGFTATQAIREYEKITGKHIPILALTANAMVQDQQRCIQSGMDDYISKPVKRRTLEMVLNKWLKH